MRTFIPCTSLWKYAVILFCLTVPGFIPAQSIPGIMGNYRNFDMDRDGINEINSLSFLPFENGQDGLQTNGRLVIVLVEDRILNTVAGSPYSNTDLLNRLLQYKDDLRAEGFYTRFIQADIYSGEKHQDGLTLLGLRKFLQDVKRSWNLQGVVLVGAFPEAMLVRRWIWRRKYDVTIAGVDYKGANQREFLRIVPEVVAHRADIVLADLDGNWQNIYRKGPENLDWIEALPATGTPANYPTDNMIFNSTTFNDRTEQFVDFFWIQDDNFQRLAAPSNTLRLRLRTALLHPELSTQNRTQANPICIPDIFVSRINPKNVAVMPDPTFRDRNGKGFLDANGKPQTVETNNKIVPQNMLVKDPIVERELLINYFDRNHLYRLGGNPSSSNRTAAANYGSGLINATNLNAYLKKASPGFAGSVSFNNVNLYDYVRFLKTPATLKGMSSHSNPWNSEYGGGYNVSQLTNLVGGHPWRWEESRVGSIFRYTPSLSAQGGTADAFLYRSIYENNILNNTGGNLFIHNGCEVNSPGNSIRVPYNHNDYGTSGGFQNAESILFYLNGVALASRAKVFYDKPEGFTEEIGKGKRKHFGEGWRAYFLKESKDANLAKDVAGNKRTYTWSIIGDWTARVHYDNGIGLFNLPNNQLRESGGHSNQSWFEDWNFDSKLNQIKGRGDLDGDGTDEFILTSNWGIGVVQLKDHQWKANLVKPNGSWFGAWRYNAPVNKGKDVIQAVADFDGDGRDELLLTSSWGIGIMDLVGANMTAKVAKPNGTRFGGWLFNSADNKIEGVGDFNKDGKADIVITSPWGISVLTLSGNTLTALVVKPNDSWFGTWRYNAKVNKSKDQIRAIDDLDGDGADELLLTSSWGIGILNLQGNSFSAAMAKPNGTRFGGWLFNSADNIIEGTGDFNRDGKVDILISSPWGIGLMTTSGNSLVSMVAKPKDTWFGQWRYNAKVNSGKDSILGIADFNNDQTDEILIRSSWGIGVLRLNGNTFTSLQTQPFGAQVGSWHLNKENSFPVIGNFDGTPGQEFLISRN